MKHVFTANGDSPVALLPGAAIHGSSDDWGGGTLTLYWREVGGDRVWHPVVDGAFTANFDLVLNFTRPVKMYGALTGATDPDPLTLIFA